MSPRYKDIDPCTDFDKFVCEGWDEQHDMRADQDSFSVGTVMHERSQQILRHILESPYTEDHLLVKSSTSARKRIFNKAQNAYEACMDENRIKELGSEPLLKILGVVATLFPAEQPDRLSDTLRRLESLQKNLIYEGANELSITIAYLERIGVNSLVVFEIGVNFSSHILFLDAA